MKNVAELLLANGLKALWDNIFEYKCNSKTAKLSTSFSENLLSPRCGQFDTKLELPVGISNTRKHSLLVFNKNCPNKIELMTFSSNNLINYRTIHLPTKRIYSSAYWRDFIFCSVVEGKIFCLDLKTLKLSTLPDMQPHRVKYELLVSNNCLYAVGGFTKDTLNIDAVYNVKSDIIEG